MATRTLHPGGASPREVATAINALIQGKSANTGSVTLDASVSSTTLIDSRIGGDSVILFMPRTANAAAGMTALYVSARAKGQATLGHANNAQTDRTYDYVVIG